MPSLLSQGNDGTLQIEEERGRLSPEFFIGLLQDVKGWCDLFLIYWLRVDVAKWTGAWDWVHLGTELQSTMYSIQIHRCQTCHALALQDTPLAVQPEKNEQALLLQTCVI